MDSEFEKVILMKKKEITELIHTNIDFIMTHYGYTKKSDFFEKISANSGVSKRKIRGWYTDRKLPNLSHEDITIICSHLKVHFSDLISERIDKDTIKSYPITTFIPAKIAKKNILNMMINFDIGNSQKFESFFESTYSSDYFNVLQRKNSHQRNVSWKFIITAAFYFDISIGALFINKEVNEYDK